MLVGALLTAFGILALAFQSGFRYQSSERLPQDGAAQVTATQEKVVSIPPVVGGLAAIGGLCLMIIAARK
jgi:hypothetical protein